MRHGAFSTNTLAVVFLACLFTGPGLASSPSEPEFVQLHLVFGETEVTGHLDVFCKSACVDSNPGPTVAFHSDKTRKLAGRTGKDLPNRTRYAIKIPAPRPYPDTKLYFNLRGLNQSSPFDLGIFIDPGDDLNVAYVAPAKSLPATRANGSRLEYQLFYADFDQDSLQIALQPKGSTFMLDVVKSLVNFTLPLFTAIVILLGTTGVNRWLSVRRQQQAEIQILRSMREKIEKTPGDAQARKELIDYIHRMKSKPEYGGFAPEFTAPLEKIVARGNINDIPKYGAELDKVRPGVKLKWVFLALQ